MNDEQIDDLKRFIASVISQQTAELSHRLDRVEGRLGHVEGKLDRLEKKMDDGFAGTADTIDKATNAQLDDHEQRLTKLEQQAA